MAVVVDRQGDPMAPEDLIEQSEVSHGCFLGFEASPDEQTQGIIDSRVQAAGWLVGTEPMMGTSVPLHHHSGLFFSGTSTSVDRRAPASLGGHARLPPYFPDRFPTEIDVFTFFEDFCEMNVVELTVMLLVQLNDSLAYLYRHSCQRHSSPAAMGQGASSSRLVTLLQPFGLAVTDVHDRTGLAKTDLTQPDLFQDSCPLQFLLTQDDSPFHRHLPLEGDIFSLQLMGTLLLC